MSVIIVLFAGRESLLEIKKTNLFYRFLRKPFSRELIDKPNVLALELRDDEVLSSTNSNIRHVW